MKLSPGNGVKSPASAELLERLRSLLAETTAYRLHYARTAVELLLAADQD
jgi:hypothetical protein